MEKYYLALMIRRNPDDPWLVSQIIIEPKDYMSIPETVHKAVDVLLLDMKQTDVEGKVFRVGK